VITPEDLRALLKKHRWTIAISPNGRQQVFSAKQRQGKKLATCYIGTTNKLNSLNEADVVEKINRKTMRLADQRDSSNQAHTEQSSPVGAYMPVSTIIPALRTKTN